MAGSQTSEQVENSHDALSDAQELETETEKTGVELLFKEEKDMTIPAVRHPRMELDVEYDLFKRPPSSVHHPRRLHATPWQKESPIAAVPRPQRSPPATGQCHFKRLRKCLRCGVLDGTTQGPCRFHPFLLKNPGPFQYTQPWLKCKNAGHVENDVGCYTRSEHFFVDDSP